MWRLPVEDVFSILGLALLAVGLWWVFPPAAFIVVGLLLMAAGYRIAAGRVTDSEPHESNGPARQPNGEPE